MGRHSCEVSTLAGCYVATAARGCGEVAELAAARKYQKYADIPSAYTFLPIAMETLGLMNDSACHFFEDLGRKISEEKGRSFSRGCRSQSSVLMLPCSTSHSLGTTIRTFCNSTFAINLFLCFLTPEPILPAVFKKRTKIIIIITSKTYILL